jgi:hypothetical protein
MEITAGTSVRVKERALSHFLADPAQKLANGRVGIVEREGFYPNTVIVRFPAVGRRKEYCPCAISVNDLEVVLATTSAKPAIPSLEVFNAMDKDVAILFGVD